MSKNEVENVQNEVALVESGVNISVNNVKISIFISYQSLLLVISEHQ